MKLTTKLLSASLFMLCMQAAIAEPINPGRYPADLTYLNRPIDPLCFFDMDSRSDTVELKTCGLRAEHYQLTQRMDDALTKKFFYGFQWRNPRMNDAPGGYSYYQAWRAGGQKYWIYTINSGGGSGDFTAINLYSRKDFDTINLKPIQSGDRCNGGISGVSQKAYDIVYAVNLTPYDLYALATNDSKSVKAYDDLAACAVCCAAKAYYQADQRAQPKLLYVELDKTRVEEMPSQGKRQACFNQLVAKYLRQKNSNLTVAEIEQFSQEFNENCKGA